MLKAFFMQRAEICSLSSLYTQKTLADELCPSHLLLPDEFSGDELLEGRIEAYDRLNWNTHTLNVQGIEDRERSMFSQPLY